MEYIYAALLLHKLGKPVSEENINRVLKSIDSEIDESKVKSLVISLKDVDIDKELESAVITTSTVSVTEEKKEEKEEKKEAAAEGLAALFG